MCFGQFAKLCHWGPLIALGVIKIVTWMTMHCLSMWWPPWTSVGSTLHAGLFLFLAGSTLFYFLSALSSGPGYVPLKWKPENQNDCEYLQYCGVCEGYKAPRAHHCRKCGRCVMKMDHHCPWINGCVGWANHWDFTLFLLFAVLGCTQATYVLVICLYRGINRNYYIHYGSGNEPLVQLTVVTLMMNVLALGLAIGVVLAVGMLLYYQFKSIVKNRTAIEEWIEEKANHRLQERESKEKFLFPYDLGWKGNISEICRRWPLGDGITWSVVEGCDQYTLTKEQLKQKTEKRERARVYSIQRGVRGGWCPLSAGLNTIIRPPCNDEPRIALQQGNYVAVTRWRKYWLFGEKIDESKCRSGKNRVRGWFPRCAATEVSGDVVELYEAYENQTDSKKEL